jgi:2,4-dienoyl-CoA reductase-like NADH-dependent reductase (Old Yellow Enzyme family)
MVMTCAANVHSDGKTFPGQLGINSDSQLEGLEHIASIIRKHGAISSVQLHHGGVRASPRLGATLVGPSDIPEIGAHGLSLNEVTRLRQDYVTAALRAQRVGFDGVELHAAFGWIPMQFLSKAYNHRTDQYGGSFENRSRFIMEIIDELRATCRPDFQIGFRVSLERYGIDLSEVRQLIARLLREEQIDYVDLAVWDYQKVVEDGPYKGKTYLSLFTELPRSRVRLGASGKIMTPRQAEEVLEGGCDYVMLGKAAILQTDFPLRAQADPEHRAPVLPVYAEYLKEQGLSDNFIAYMRTWEGFVKD